MRNIENNVMYRNESILYNNNTFAGLLAEEYLELCDTYALQNIVEHFVNKNTDLYNQAQEMIYNMESDNIGENVDIYDNLLETIKSLIGEETGIVPNYVLWLDSQNNVAEKYKDFVLSGYDVTNAVPLAESADGMILFGFAEEPYSIVKYRFPVRKITSPLADIADREHSVD